MPKSDDYRANAARYYDLGPSDSLRDVPFYIQRVPSPDAAILELGCGTGRVLLQLMCRCGAIHGIDHSPAMLAVCRERLARSGAGPPQVRVELGDITALDLGRKFDLIIAPFRVMQNLESDPQVEGLLDVARRHLAPGATCILNVFRPNRDRETLMREWPSDDERLSWEIAIEGGRVTCHDRKVRVEPQPLVLYPRLIYRRYRASVLVDTATLDIAMRCYYPDEFEALIVDHGFEIVGRWGGYQGEPYGEGPELVLQFALPLDS